MKKMLLVATIAVAGMMSANLPEVETAYNDYQFDSTPSCVGVESDCGQGGITVTQKIILHSSCMILTSL